MTKENVVLKREKNGLVYLFINRPEVKNALNLEAIIDIKNTLEYLKSDKSIRVLVITGTEKTFSAGADLKWMKESKNLDFRDNKRDALLFADMLKEVDEFPVPTISLVNGHAYGGAIGIIAASDFSIAIHEAKFSFSEVKLGIIPAMIAPYVLRSIGFQNSNKLFLTAEVFDAAEAKKRNLIDEIIAGDSIDNYLKSLISKLIKGSPNAQKTVKEFLRNIMARSISEQLIDETANTIAKIRISKEGQEGLSAFLEKRKPNWYDT